MNRLGRSAPAANPSAENAGRLAAPTATGHHSGPPQAPCRAVTAYSTATQPRYATSAQQVVAAQVASWRAHRGREVPDSRSAMPWRASREPSQRGGTDHVGTKTATAVVCMVIARTFHIGGNAMAGRYAIEPEQRDDDRQHPQHHVAAQLQPQQPTGRRQRQCDVRPGRVEPA